MPTAITAFVGTAPRGPVDEAVRVGSIAELETAFGGPAHQFGLGAAVGDYFRNGGEQAWVVRVASSGRPDADRGVADVHHYAGDGVPGRGIRALDAVDAVNVLVLPPPMPDGELPAAVWAHALAYAVERRAFLIVDPPPGLTPQQVSVWATTTAGLDVPTADHAALYYPRLLRDDPLRRGAVVAVAPSGAIAGLFARTDRERGVWKAPAGQSATLVGVRGVERALTDHEAGALNEAGVNVVRSFPGLGTVCWGARTLRGAGHHPGDFRYISVRRLFLHVAASIERSTAWVVFEPNGASLWLQLRTSIEPFLHDLWRSGAFAGATAADAYFVRCDSSTTTLSDIERGVVNVQLGLAVLKPAEFVVLTVRLAAQPGVAPPARGESQRPAAERGWRKLVGTLLQRRRK